jgi:hypothetical protein
VGVTAGADRGPGRVEIDQKFMSEDLLPAGERHCVSDPHFHFGRQEVRAAGQK